MPEEKKRVEARSRLFNKLLAVTFILLILFSVGSVATTILFNKRLSKDVSGHISSSFDSVFSGLEDAFTSFDSIARDNIIRTSGIVDLGEIKKISQNGHNEFRDFTKDLILRSKKALSLEVTNLFYAVNRDTNSVKFLYDDSVDELLGEIAQKNNLDDQKLKQLWVLKKSGIEAAQKGVEKNISLSKEQINYQLDLISTAVIEEVDEAAQKTGNEIDKATEFKVEQAQLMTGSSGSLLLKEKNSAIGNMAKIKQTAVLETARNIQKTQQKGLFSLVIAVVILALLAILASLLVARSISRLIAKLSYAAQIIGEGNLDYKIGINTKDEIGQLANAFDAMTENLKKITASRDDLNKEVAERKIAEMALDIEKESLAVTLRSIGDGVISVDINANVTMMNPVAEKLTGWKLADAKGNHLSKVFDVYNNDDKPMEDWYKRVLEYGDSIELLSDVTLVEKGGNKRMVADSAAPIRETSSDIIGMVIVFRDVTDKKRIEEELTKVHKLESVGILAGGIAHDFNNTLTAILNNLTLIRMSRKVDEETLDLVARTEDVTLRARSLTQQLLTFSKGGAPIVKATDIVKLLNEATKFVLHGSNVKSEFKIASDIWPVDVDADQISQVIHNLVINADQAMAAGGTLTIEVENISVDKGLPLTPGNYVKILFIDNGPGVEISNLSKVFDPYFSTKAKGTGLGLTIVYSIIKQHKGHITIDSTVNKGTTFTIHLPASTKAIKEVVKPKKAEALSGNGKILVMDDQITIRESIANILNFLGYEVDLAADGKEAIDKYKEQYDAGTPYDVVILDLTVPGGIGGKEAIQEMKAIDPNIKSIVSSGYSNDPIMSDYKEYGFTEVAAKPYGIDFISQLLIKLIKGED